MWPQAEGLSYIYHSPHDGIPRDFYSTRHAAPCIFLTPHCDKRATEKQELVGVRQLMNECATASQRSALKRLTQIWLARNIVCAMPVKPRFSSLLIGLSGSGKTWVVNQFSRSVHLPVFQTSPGRWHLRGGTSGTEPTLNRIEQELTRGPRLILIDEIDKTRVGPGSAGADNQNYFRSVLDEIMAVIDGTAFDTPSVLDALAGSQLIAAGAFQDLYKARLGAWNFLEEVEDLAPLTFTDLTSAGWLSDELLNRLGSVIELRPPGVAELEKQMSAIEKAAGIARLPGHSPEGMAKAMMGMRGLELYALDVAIAGISRPDSGAKPVSGV